MLPFFAVLSRPVPPHFPSCRCESLCYLFFNGTSVKGSTLGLALACLSWSSVTFYFTYFFIFYSCTFDAYQGLRSVRSVPSSSQITAVYWISNPLSLECSLLIIQVLGLEKLRSSSALSASLAGILFFHLRKGLATLTVFVRWFLSSPCV